MTKKQRADEKPRVDAEFIKTFNPEFTFEIMGNTFRARSLNIGHYSELKTMFPKWDGLSIGALIADYSPEALIEVCWLGVRNLNDLLPTKEFLIHTINGNTFDGWTIAWQKMTGLGTDSPEEPDIKKNDEILLETGDLSQV